MQAPCVSCHTPARSPSLTTYHARSPPPCCGQRSPYNKRQRSRLRPTMPARSRQTLCLLRRSGCNPWAAAALLPLLLVAFLGAPASSAAQLVPSAHIPIWGEDFEDLAPDTGFGRNATAVPFFVSWNISVTPSMAATPIPSSYFKVVPQREGTGQVLEAYQLGTVARWHTEVFFTQCAVNLSATIHVSAQGAFRPIDSLVVYYIAYNARSPDPTTTTTAPEELTAATSTSQIGSSSSSSSSSSTSAPTSATTPTPPPEEQTGSGSGDDPGLLLPPGAVPVAQLQGDSIGSGDPGVLQQQVHFFSKLNAVSVQLGVEVMLDAESEGAFRIDNVTVAAEAPIREEAFWAPWSSIEHGNWSEWQPTACGVNQTRSRSGLRTRTCIVPTCAPPGTYCPGGTDAATQVVVEEESRDADENCCAVDGDWSDWAVGEWSSWSPFEPEKCGVTQTRSRIRRRSRTCTAPAPACGGAACSGNSTRVDEETETRSAEDNCCPQDGQWAPWVPEPWSEWSSFIPAECGVEQRRERLRIKIRTCTDPPPSCGGDACAGFDRSTDTEIETRSAEENCCPVNGSYTEWQAGPWSEWTAFGPDECGVNQTRARTQVQRRTCAAPSPACGGLACTGPHTRDVVDLEYRSAEDNCCPVDGGLTPWAVGPWSSWSPYLPDRCGVVQNRTRQRAWTRNCTNPSPACGGAACGGATAKNDIITASRTAEENCCPVDGEFSPWKDGPWSEWSAFEPQQCGVLQTRTRTKQQMRQCNSPAPACGGAACMGETTRTIADTETRNSAAVVDGGWSDAVPVSPWTDWSAPWPPDCSKLQTQNRTRTLNRTCTNPSPQCGGRVCQGPTTLLDVEYRNISHEPIHGGFSAWVALEPWSAWTPFFPPGCEREQHRNRTRVEVRACTNPAPACGGRDCDGSTSRVAVDMERRSEEESCVPGCVKNATYTEWQVGPWSPWTPTLNRMRCDTPQTQTRVRRRTRQCVPPVCGGTPCTKDLFETIVASRDVTLHNYSAALGDWVPGSWSPWVQPYTLDNAHGCNLTSGVWLRMRADMRTCTVPRTSCNPTACNAHKTQRIVKEWFLGPDPPSVQSSSSSSSSIAPSTTIGNDSTNGGSTIAPLPRGAFQSDDCCAGFEGWSTLHTSPWSEWQYPDINALKIPCDSTRRVKRTRARNVTRVCDAAGTACAAAACIGEERIVERQADMFPVVLLPEGWTPFTFGPWTPWRFVSTVGCGSQRVRTSTRIGQRECTSPWPSCRCSGPSTTVETRNETVTGDAACDSACVVDGGWSRWVPANALGWSVWSNWLPRHCGVAQQSNRTRTVVRSCVDPAPACGGAECPGDDTMVEVDFRHRTAEENCCGCFTCAEGQFVAQAATSTRSATCLPCPAGSAGDGIQCSTCDAGVYAPSGSGPTCAALACPEGTTDHDADPATACVACQASGCPAGSFPVTPCTATTDLRCNPCPPNTFSPDGLLCRACDAPCGNGTYAATICNGRTNYQCLPCSPENTCPYGVKQPCQRLVDTLCYASAEEANSNTDDDGSGGGTLSQPWLIVVLCLGGLFIATNCYWIGRQWNRPKQSELYPVSHTEMSVLGPTNARPSSSSVKAPQHSRMLPDAVESDLDSGMAETPVQAWMMPAGRIGAGAAGGRAAGSSSSSGNGDNAAPIPGGTSPSALPAQPHTNTTGGGFWRRGRRGSAKKAVRNGRHLTRGKSAMVVPKGVAQPGVVDPSQVEVEMAQGPLESRATPSPHLQQQRKWHATQRRKPSRRPGLQQVTHEPSLDQRYAPFPYAHPLAGDESGSSIGSANPTPDYLTAAPARPTRDPAYAEAGRSVPHRHRRRMTQRLPSHKRQKPTASRLDRRRVSLQRGDDQGDVIVDDHHFIPNAADRSSSSSTGVGRTAGALEGTTAVATVNTPDADADDDASSLDSNYCLADDVGEPPYAQATDVGIYSDMPRTSTMKSRHPNAAESTYARAGDFPVAQPESGTHTYSRAKQPAYEHGGHVSMAGAQQWQQPQVCANADAGGDERYATLMGGTIDPQHRAYDRLNHVRVTSPGSVLVEDDGQAPTPLALHDEEMEESFYSIFSAHATTNEEEVPEQVLKVFNNLGGQRAQDEQQHQKNGENQTRQQQRLEAAVTRGEPPAPLLTERDHKHRRHESNDGKRSSKASSSAAIHTSADDELTSSSSSGTGGRGSAQAHRRGVRLSQELATRRHGELGDGGGGDQLGEGLGSKRRGPRLQKEASDRLKLTRPYSDADVRHIVFFEQQEDDPISGLGGREHGSGGSGVGTQSTRRSQPQQQQRQRQRGREQRALSEGHESPPSDAPVAVPTVSPAKPKPKPKGTTTSNDWFSSFVQQHANAE